ncbi:MAG: hypothetical protein ACM34I_06665 [bacterium]
MYEECKGIQSWFTCLNCTLLSTRLCPLEGEDAIDKIVNRIRMIENPEFNAFKEHHLNNISSQP